MNRSLLILMTTLVVLGGIGEVSADDGLNHTHEPEDTFDYQPFLVLILIAAVVFVLAKYGP